MLNCHLSLAGDIDIVLGGSVMCKSMVWHVQGTYTLRWGDVSCRKL